MRTVSKAVIVPRDFRCTACGVETARGCLRLVTEDRTVCWACASAVADEMAGGD